MDLQIAPRILRMSVAPAYFGMSVRVFNQEVRPFITEIRIGRQGVGFLRKELDQWVNRRVEAAATDARTQGTSGRMNIRPLRRTNEGVRNFDRPSGNQGNRVSCFWADGR